MGGRPLDDQSNFGAAERCDRGREVRQAYAATLKEGIWKFVLLSPSLHTGVECVYPENNSPPRDIKIAVIRSTEAAVLRRHLIRSFDIAQVLAFGVEHLNARRRCGKSVARAVNAQAVGAADESVVGLFF